MAGTPEYRDGRSHAHAGRGDDRRAAFLPYQPFSLILDALPDGVAIYDRDGNLVWINDKACQMLGFPRAELIGRNVKELVILPTIQAFVTPEFAGSPPTAAWSQGKRIEDFASPGYLVFTNGW